MPDILRLPPAPVPERGRPKISHLVYFCGLLHQLGGNHEVHAKRTAFVYRCQYFIHNLLFKESSQTRLLWCL